MEKELVILWYGFVLNKWNRYLIFWMDYFFYMGWSREFFIGNII